MTPKIYLYCLCTGYGSGNIKDSNGNYLLAGGSGSGIGYALAEDGNCLAQHLSSNIYYSKHDMGLTSDWKHDNYSKHYSDGFGFGFGFELEWIDEKDLDIHVGWNEAFKLNKELAIKAKEEGKE